MSAPMFKPVDACVFVNEDGMSHAFSDSLPVLFPERKHDQDNRYVRVMLVSAAWHKEALSALRDIAMNYDHEDQTHDHAPFKYGGHCRVCTAERALALLPDGAE